MSNLKCIVLLEWRSNIIEADFNNMHKCNSDCHACRTVCTKNVFFLPTVPTRPIQPEQFNADILFLIDSSSPVNEEDFKVQKDFVSLIAKYLNVLPSRAALIVYGGDPTLSLRYLYLDICNLKIGSFNGVYCIGNTST